MNKGKKITVVFSPGRPQRVYRKTALYSCLLPLLYSI